MKETGQFGGRWSGDGKIRWKCSNIVADWTHFSSLVTPWRMESRLKEVTNSSSNGQGSINPKLTLAAQTDIAANMEGEYSIKV